MFVSPLRAPTEEQIRAHTAAIEPVPAGVNRPFWSVMIPTYNCAHFLRQTLDSVLSQDPGPEHMQIEVLDDCSTRDDPEAVVRELGKGRVTFYRHPSNQGATRNFTACVQRAHGQWVHLLHGDDMVMPGFYDAYRAVIGANPSAVMVVGKVATMDEHDRWRTLLGTLPKAGSDVIENFTQGQALEQLGQFAGIVVRRDAYERAGGFCSLYGHVADWDMWFRISLLGPVVGLPRPYALYRTHSAADTNKQGISGNNIREFSLVIQSNLARLPLQPPGAEGWRSHLAGQAEGSAYIMAARNSTEGQLNQARWAWALAPNFRRFRLLVKSWLKHRFRSRQPHSVGS